MLKPLRDIVLIDPEPTFEPEGKVIIPQAQQYFTHRGTVVAVGPGDRDSKTGKLLPAHTQAGDDVLYSPLHFMELQMGRKKWVMVRDQDVLVILRNIPAGEAQLG